MPPKKRKDAVAATEAASTSASAAESQANKKQKNAAAVQVARAPQDEDKPATTSVISAATDNKPPVITDGWAASANLPDRIVRMVRRLREAASRSNGYIRRVNLRMIIPHSGEQFLHYGNVWLDDGTTRYLYPDRTPTGLYKPAEGKSQTALNTRLPGGSYPPSEDNCYDLKDLLDVLLQSPLKQEGVDPLLDFLIGRRDDWPHVQKGGIRYRLGKEDTFRENMPGVTPDEAPSYPQVVYILDRFRGLNAVRLSEDKKSFQFARATQTIIARPLTVPVDTIVPLRIGDADPPAFYTLASMYFFATNLGGSYARYKTAAAKAGHQIVPLGEVGGFITGAGNESRDLEDIPDHLLDLEAWARFQALTPVEQTRVQETSKPPPPAPKVKKAPAAEASSDDAPAAAAAASAEDAASTDAAASEEQAAASSSKKAKGKKVSASAAAAAEASSGVVDLSGKRFVVMGEFDRGKFRVESQIADVGGVVTKAVTKTVAYVICGRSVETQYGGISGKGSKAYSEAKKMKITILNESEFQQLLDAHHAHKKASLQGIANELIPELSNIVAEYASSMHVDASELGAVWLDICRMRGLDAEADGGVTDDQIRVVEEQLKLALPRDLKSVLKVSNGSNSADHPWPLFPDLQTIASENKYGLGVLFRDEGFKYLSLSNEMYMDLRGNSIMLVRPGESICIEQVAMSLRAQLETYHAVVKLKLLDLEDRVKDALLRGQAQNEYEFLRSIAGAAWLNSHPVPADESEETRALREENELRQLRGAHARTDMDDICGPHADAIARYKRFVDRRIAARAAAREPQAQPPAEQAFSDTTTAAAAASSAASAPDIPMGIPSADEVQLGRPLKFPEYPYEFRKKHGTLINRFYRGYDS